MSRAESSSLTPKAPEDEKQARSERSGSDGGEKERVLKEVGLTSATFIGPVFPPQAGTVKPDIEDSLSEFYKELQEIEPPDGAGTEQHDTPEGREEDSVHTRSFDEADGWQKRLQRKHTWSHWYQNEPYHPRRPRQEFNSGRDASEQKQWNHAPSVKFPPRPPFPHQAASPAFLSPQTPPAARVDPSFYHLGSTSCSPGQSFDSLDDVWERRHHPPAPGHDHALHALPGLVLILMRGLPGSGKSTRARELLSSGPNGVILSTDDYFDYRDGYRYEPGLLGAAHEWNQRRAKDALFDGRSPVIIDNTNLQAWEMKPYVQMAVDRGYRVHFCEPETSWKFDTFELERRNKHGVPQEKILQMLDRYASPVSVDIVLNSHEPSHVHQRPSHVQQRPWSRPDERARRTRDKH